MERRKGGKEKGKRGREGRGVRLREGMMREVYMYYRLKNCVCIVAKAGRLLHLMAGSYIMTLTSLKVTNISLLPLVSIPYIIIHGYFIIVWFFIYFRD